MYSIKKIKIAQKKRSYLSAFTEPDRARLWWEARFVSIGPRGQTSCCSKGVPV